MFDFQTGLIILGGAMAIALWPVVALCAGIAGMKGSLWGGFLAALPGSGVGWKGRRI